MDTLHTNDYDITQATSFLVPRGPVLCADELEAWTQGGSMWEIVQRGAKLFGGGGGQNRSLHSPTGFNLRGTL